jgi:hypothetical protein
MRKLAALVTVVALCAVGTAQAEKTKPSNSPKPPKPPKAQSHKPAKPANPNSARCVARSEGYNASGTLVSAPLTAQGRGRYSGTLVLEVTKANHRAPTGSQTYTLSDARVKFRHGVNPASPPAGSHVKLSGKITELPNKHCSTAGFTPTITIETADIRAAKH